MDVYASIDRKQVVLLSLLDLGAASDYILLRPSITS